MLLFGVSAMADNQYNDKDVHYWKAKYEELKRGADEYEAHEAQLAAQSEPYIAALEKLKTALTPQTAAFKMTELPQPSPQEMAAFVTRMKKMAALMADLKTHLTEQPDPQTQSTALSVPAEQEEAVQQDKAMPLPRVADFPRVRPNASEDGTVARDDSVSPTLTASVATAAAGSTATASTDACTASGVTGGGWCEGNEDRA